MTFYVVQSACQISGVTRRPGELIPAEEIGMGAQPMLAMQMIALAPAPAEPRQAVEQPEAEKPTARRGA